MERVNAAMIGTDLGLRDRLFATVERFGARRIRERIDAFLADTDITIGGERPWDPVVRAPRCFGRVLRDGMLGAGEAYVDGDWDCAALDELAARIARAGADRKLHRGWREITGSLLARIMNRQNITAAAANGQEHYDIGDDLYSAMLGSSMVYSCGYWRSAETLDDAQRAKLELVCAKLQLERGQRLLDVGCGYGELAHHAAEHHGVEVVGITVSHHQGEHARVRCAGLPVEIRVQDYREVGGRFDRIVSVGMFEHVGVRNYRRFFEHVRRSLEPDGLFLLHTIGNLDANPSFNPWLDRYVFPGAMLPSASRIAAAIDGLFVIEDWHNFGTDYDRTLLAWHDNFEAAWPTLAHYGEPFRRKWRFYLLTSAGTFRARRNQLWQLVLSARGVEGGYRRPLL
jgi:cyclopropane-fatty-acyl-phospholipid synthase